LAGKWVGEMVALTALMTAVVWAALSDIYLAGQTAALWADLKAATTGGERAVRWAGS